MASAADSAAELSALAAGVFGDEVPTVAQLTDLRVLAEVVQGPGDQNVTVADLEARVRLVHGLPADAEVTADQVRDLVAMTGEARALLPAGVAVTGAHLAAVPGQRAAQAAAFADLPANAVAVRADGVYMTVPGGVGAVEQMGHPQFFAAGSEEVGHVRVSQISSDAAEVSFRVIGKTADDLPRVSGLVLWYMAAYSGARRFAVYDILSERLRRILGRLGMSAVGGWGLDMRGDAEVVARNAAAAAVADGWVLRIPRPETPALSAAEAGVGGQDTAFADLPADAVAVHADGSYLTVPSGIGVLAGMGHPRLFSRDGQQRGQVRLAGIEERADELTLDEITGATELSCLAVWYLAAHTAAPQITVTDVVEGRFSGALASVGLTWSGSEQMTGDTRRVARYAAAAASRAGWTVRTPVAVPAVTYVNSPEFAAAVAELEVHLYRGETPPVPLREVFEYLIGEGRIEAVPTAGELPAVIAGLSGIPVGDVDRAQVDRVLEDLAHEVAGRSQAGSTGTGLLGGRRVMAVPSARRARVAVPGAKQAVATVRSRVQANAHLLATVNLQLQKWQRPLVGIDDLRRALDESPPINTDHRGMAHHIAEYLAFRAVTRVRGGASGIEAALPDSRSANFLELADSPSSDFLELADSPVSDFLELGHSPLSDSQPLPGPFAGLPEQAVAVRSDGTCLSVPSGAGVIQGAFNLEFLTASGGQLGHIELAGVYENSEEAGFFSIANKTNGQVRGVTNLAAWYLAAHATAERVRVRAIANSRLGAILGNLGMRWDNVDMVGDRATVLSRAADEAREAGWTLREPPTVPDEQEPGEQVVDTVLEQERVTPAGPSAGVAGPAELAQAGQYLRASQVELPAGVRAAQAEASLAAVVAGAAAAEHPAAMVAGQPGAGEIVRGLRLLGGLVPEVCYINAWLSEDQLDLYQEGEQVTAQGLMVAGFDLPGPSEGQNTRFVIFPLAGRSGRYASQGRDASLLLGYGAAVFPPGTTFTVHDQYSYGVNTVMLVETPAGAEGPVGLDDPAGLEDVLPVTGPGTLGLNESLHRYLYLSAVDVELAMWADLEPEQRLAAAPQLIESLLDALNARLAALGVPTLEHNPEAAGAGAGAAFDAWSWELVTGLLPADRQEARRVAAAFWHEGHHAVQRFDALCVRPGPLTPERTAVNVSRVLLAAEAPENRPAPGSARYAAGEYWHSVFYGDDFSEQPVMLARYGNLFAALEERREALDEAERAGAEEAELDALRQAVKAARQRYVQDGYLPLNNRPEEWDASGTEILLMPGRAPLLEPLPSGKPIFVHEIGVWEQGRTRLGLGVDPGFAADVLVSPLGNVAVVHGRGWDGWLDIDGDEVDIAWLHRLLDALAEPGDDVVLLASDSHMAAQELADAREGRVWAPPPPREGTEPAEVWVSLGTGAVAVGWGGSLNADGRLQITPVPLHRYEPRPAGSASPPTGSQADFEVAGVAQDEAVRPIRTLTGAQVLADPGPWQRRTAPEPEVLQDDGDAGPQDSAEPVSYVDGPDFAAAVAELEVHLYGDEPPPVPLREVFEYLIGEGWIEEVPTAGELRAVIAGLSGIPVGDVDRAEVDRVLEYLAHEVAGRSQAGSTGTGLLGGRRVMAVPLAAGRVLRARRLGLDRPATVALPGLAGSVAGKGAADAASAAGLGAFNARSFDREWGKLPSGSWAVARAITRARELIGRRGPVIGVMTPEPISELDPLARAVRRLALQIYRDPGNHAVAQALARNLAEQLDEYKKADDHLLAAVNLQLQKWQRPLVGIEDLQRALDESPPINTDHRGMAQNIAEYLVRREVTRVRGGGSGIEAEFTHLMTISAHDLDRLVAQRAMLAVGPDRMFAVTVDDKVYFLGRDGRYYRTKADAESAPGDPASEVKEVKFAMPEFVSNVTSTFPDESGYSDHEPVFMELSRLEQILAELPREAGSLPDIPLSQVLRPEDGYELTAAGRHALIGPRPVGDWLGAHIHHTFGVPLTGLYLFLEHVRDHTWRDESKGYLTRAHLDDGLEFGSRIAFRFIMEKYFPDGNLPLGASTRDVLARLSASDPAVAQLRGYAALLYTGAATVAHNLIHKGLNKVHAAVLARHDMAQILAALRPEVRDYLGRNVGNIMSRFERSIRTRIPDYDDQFRKRWFDKEEGGGPATINLLHPPMDWARAHEFGLPISPANYLLGGLDPARAPQIPQYLYMGMSTLPGLDTNHLEELGFELVVLEVRSYGARHVSAEDARAQHEQLAAVVRELGARARDQEIALAASVRQIIRESLEEDSGTLNLTLAAPLVAGHPRPRVIWQAALDFLRAEPAITSQIRFVEDAWRDIGQPWNIIPLPPGIRQLLGVGGPTVISGTHTAGRRTVASSGQDPEPVAVTFPYGWTDEEDMPDSLELTALARWLAEVGGASTQHGEQLPQVRITGFGDASSLDPTGESARRTGQQRADAVRASLLSSVRHYLRLLGADPAIADSLLPADLATGAYVQNLATNEAAGQAVVTVHARPGDGTPPQGGVPPARRDRGVRWHAASLPGAVPDQKLGESSPKP